MHLKRIAVLITALVALQAQAQSTLPTSGTLVIVPANGEVTHPNDEAIVNFMIEEQDKDKAVAASRVNQKMKQGSDIVRREDPTASLKTMGYYTYPVYANEHNPDTAASQPRTPRKPIPIGWRVGQQLEVKTTNIANLPKMAAATQKVLGLSGVNFGLSPATTKKLDNQRIAAAYQNLNERVAAIATAMGRKVSDAVLDTVDFEGSGNYAGNNPDVEAKMMMRAAHAADAAQVSEPSFEPGETTLQMRLVGKVKFK